MPQILKILPRNSRSSREVLIKNKNFGFNLGDKDGVHWLMDDVKVVTVMF